jgi:hypothetical protein
MHTKTWRLGTDTELDQLFETLRRQQYNNHNHKLWKNYSYSAFAECEAVSINFVDDSPFFCSGILKKSCWPDNTYRILNRLWKPAERASSITRLSPGLGSMLHSQLDWLKENTDYKLAFISRETNHWQQFFLDNFKKYFDLEFKMDDNKYLTCNNAKDPSCWQKIIYYGDHTILSSWEKDEK